MNDSNDLNSTCCSGLDDAVRENPTRSIVCAVGAGLLLGLLVRGFHHRPPEARAARLLDELRERIENLAEPASRRARSLAKKGASLVEDGSDEIDDLHLDSKVKGLTRKLRDLFH